LYIWYGHEKKGGEHESDHILMNFCGDVTILALKLFFFLREVSTPKGRIKYQLYRDSTNYRNGNFVKDLSRLDRDMKRVLVIDHNRSSLSHPENGVIISPFTDQLDDRELCKLWTLLYGIVRYNVYDVREKIKLYNEDPDGQHFKKEIEWTERRRILDDPAEYDWKRRFFESPDERNSGI